MISTLANAALNVGAVMVGAVAIFVLVALCGLGACLLKAGIDHLAERRAMRKRGVR